MMAKLRPQTNPNLQLRLPGEPIEEELDEWAESPKEGWADIVRVRRAARTQEAKRREAAACMIQVGCDLQPTGRMYNKRWLKSLVFSLTSS
jgi:hypothetical protein